MRPFSACVASFFVLFVRLFTECRWQWRYVVVGNGTLETELKIFHVFKKKTHDNDEQTKMTTGNRVYSTKLPKMKVHIDTTITAKKKIKLTNDKNGKKKLIAKSRQVFLSFLRVEVRSVVMWFQSKEGKNIRINVIIIPILGVYFWFSPTFSKLSLTLTDIGQQWQKDVLDWAKKR